MLSCEAVVEILPGIEAGESATGDVRDHLASCEACRTEAAAIRADLARVRADLAVLSPSPFLEERVLEAARSPVPSSTNSRPPLRWGVLVGMAAAALLAGVLIIASRAPEPSAEHGRETIALKEGEAEKGNTKEGPSQVEVPPTAMQVAGQRRKGHPLGNSEHELLTLTGAPPKGMALLGTRFLAHFLPEGMISLSDGLEKARAKLTQGGKQPFVLVWVSNPQSGAEAIVRAQISAQYSGSLLLEEPLARALGLQQHELPGYVTIAGDLAMKANRTRARVRVADLDEVIEIQTHFEGKPPAADFTPVRDKETESRLEFVGERPDTAMIGSTLVARGDRLVMESVTATTFDRKTAAPVVLRTKQSTPSILLHYLAKDRNACAVILPALDCALGGPKNWRMTMQRVTLTQRFEPGAAIAIARVWRGATAIPSRESVAFTKADAKGVVSFVRTGGEVGPLRLREWRRDGSVHWHALDLDPAPAQQGRVVVLPDGRIRFAGSEFKLLPFGPAHAYDKDALAALRSALAKAADDIRGRDGRGVSLLEVIVEADKQTPWHIIWNLVAAFASPEVKIDRIRFALPGRKKKVLLRLPSDAAASRGRPSLDGRWKAHQFALKRNGDSTHWRGLRAEEYLPLRTDHEWGQLAQRLRTYVGKTQSAEAEPSMALAAWHDVPYADVRRVIQAAQAAGIEDIRLQSSPPR